MFYFFQKIVLNVKLAEIVHSQIYDAHLGG